MANKDIIQELNDLGSSLAKKTLQVPYSVPEGYFEAFADRVLSLLRDDESWLYSLPKETPYQVPADYFDGLEERIMEMVRSHPDYQTSEEELRAISPLLSSLNKRPVYSVPGGYFESFNVAAAENDTHAKVIGITSRKWFRYAAAAVITGAIGLGAIVVSSRNKIDPKDNPQGWVAKNLKKVSSKEINDFVTLANDESALKESVAVNNKIAEFKDLMKDVPVAEIDRFLAEASVEDEPGNGLSD